MPSQSLTSIDVLQDEPVDRTKHWGDLDEEEEEEEEDEEEDEDAELGEDEMADGVSSVDTISTYVHISILSHFFIVISASVGTITAFSMYEGFIIHMLRVSKKCHSSAFILVQVAKQLPFLCFQVLQARKLRFAISGVCSSMCSGPHKFYLLLRAGHQLVWRRQMLLTFGKLKGKNLRSSCTR